MNTTPPGWYPDPANPGGTRWWDGSAWGDAAPATAAAAAPPAPGRAARAPKPPRAPSTPLTWVGIIGMLAAVAVLAGGIVIGVVGLSDSGLADVLREPLQSAPGRSTVELSSGDYMIYSQSSGGFAEFSKSDVRVVDPSGNAVSTSTPSTKQTISRDGVLLVGIAEFRASEAGSYEVTVRGSRDSKYIVARSLTSGLGSVGWIIGGVLGGAVIGIAGLGILLYARLRRARPGTVGA